MTPLLTFITVTLTASVIFLLGWTLGFSYGLKRGHTREVFEPSPTLKCSNKSFASWMEDKEKGGEHGNI